LVSGQSLPASAERQQLKNHWLDVQVVGKKMNRMGIGAQVRVTRGGELLGWREIATGYGYASGQPAVAHFGLGDVTQVDVEVKLPGGKDDPSIRVKADQKLVVARGVTADAIRADGDPVPVPRLAPGPAIDLAAGVPGGKKVLTDSSPLLLKGTATLQEGVRIAKTAPTVDFLY